MCYSIQSFRSITENINSFYNGFNEKTSFPDFVNIDERDIEQLFTDDEMTKYIESIYTGVSTPDNIPFRVYQKVGETLEQGVFGGFGGSPFDFAIQSPAFEMVENLRVSTWVFSGVKNATHIFEAQKLIFDKDGFKKPFNVYRDEVGQLFDTRYDNWLKAEFQTAIAQSRSANQWLDISENGLPLLQYQTVGDRRVRNEHASLDNIVRPKNDKFWKKYFPPNGWNCRCDVIELDEGDEPVTDLSTKDIEPITPLFEGNAGIEQVVFPTSHPYFNIGKSSKELRELAKKNFNLPIPPPSPSLMQKTIKIERLKFKNHNELNKHYSKKLNVKINFDENVPIDIANEQLIQIEKLSKEYNAKDLIQIQNFEGGFKGDRANVLRIGKGREAILSYNSWDFSITKRGKKRYLNLPEEREIENVSNFNVIVDKINNPIKTTTHEFAHILTGSSKQKLNDFLRQNEKDEFFKRAKSIKIRYIKELNEIKNQWNEDLIDLKEYRNLKRKVFVSDYAKTNIDEFVAECFAQYKLSSNPSKYAVEIGELIDEFYKK